MRMHGSLFTMSGLDYHQYDWTSNLGVGGIMVSIAAFQAVDPGSIPGRRNIFSTSGCPQQEEKTILTFPKIYSIPGVQKGFPTPGIEPGPPG